MKRGSLSPKTCVELQKHRKSEKNDYCKLYIFLYPSKYGGNKKIPAPEKRK
jgi:hypothetical protein